MKSLLRFAAASAVALALAAGFSFALAHRPGAPRPGGPTGPSAVASMGAHGESTSGDESSRTTEPGYRLKSLPVVTKVVLAVQENYVDPRRVNPKAMLAGSLGAVERTVAEVMVDGDVSSGKVKVTVGERVARLPSRRTVARSGSYRRCSAEVMYFVQEHLIAHENLGRCGCTGRQQAVLPDGFDIPHSRPARAAEVLQRHDGCRPAASSAASASSSGCATAT